MKNREGEDRKEMLGALNVTQHLLRRDVVSILHCILHSWCRNRLFSCKRLCILLWHMSNTPCRSFVLLFSQCKESSNIPRVNSPILNRFPTQRHNYSTAGRGLFLWSKKRWKGNPSPFAGLQVHWLFWRFLMYRLMSVLLLFSRRSLFMSSVRFHTAMKRNVSQRFDWMFSASFPFRGECSFLPEASRNPFTMTLGERTQ